MGTVLNGGSLRTLKAYDHLAGVRVLNARLKKIKEKACFSKGKNTQIKVNCNSMAYMSFMKSYKKPLFGNPTINLQLFKVSFHFSWLLTQEHPEKPGSLQGCSRVPVVGSHRRSM